MLCVDSVASTLCCRALNTIVQVPKQIHSHYNIMCFTSEITVFLFDHKESFCFIFIVAMINLKNTTII